jgi:hypothetical protein
MRVFPRPRFWRVWRHRLRVAAVALVYLFVAFEIPLPAAVSKDSEQPFPCQHHLCGCQTAEQCWRHCCCFTAEERWVWARAHDVTPPDYAEKPTARSAKVEEPAASGSWNSVKLRDRDRCEKQASAVTNCCSAQAGRSSCCASTPKSETNATPPKSGTLRWGATLTAAQCQSYATVWITIGAVLPMTPSAAWLCDWTPPTRLHLSSPHADSIPTIPPDPPPRIVLV